MNQMLYMTDEAITSGGGLPFSLFGFATVFAVLALIMVVIMIFGKIFGTSAPKSAPVKKLEEKKEPAVTSEPVVQTAQPVSASNDSAIVAAITAAITSFRSSNGEGGGFRVVSFKKRK